MCKYNALVHTTQKAHTDVTESMVHRNGQFIMVSVLIHTTS